MISGGGVRTVKVILWGGTMGSLGGEGRGKKLPVCQWGSKEAAAQMSFLVGVYIDNFFLQALLVIQSTHTALPFVSVCV